MEWQREKISIMTICPIYPLSTECNFCPQTIKSVSLLYSALKFDGRQKAYGGWGQECTQFTSVGKGRKVKWLKPFPILTQSGRD